MDTNLTATLLTLLAEKHAAATPSAVSPVITAIGIIAGVLTVSIPAILAYFTARDTKKIATDTAKVVADVKVDVNSGATAMRKDLAAATSQILEMAKELATLKESANNTIARDKLTAGVAAAINSSPSTAPVNDSGQTRTLDTTNTVPSPNPGVFTDAQIAQIMQILQAKKP